MRLAVSVEQSELRESVRRFLADRAPVSRVRELMETPDGSDRQVWQQAGARGVRIRLALEELGPVFVKFGQAVSTRRDLLPGIASGQTVATLAFTEDDGSWEPAAIRLAATRRDDGWVLDGRKSFVLDGHTADLILVVAAGDSGLSLFAVPADAAGLDRQHQRAHYRRSDLGAAEANLRSEEGARGVRGLSERMDRQIAR